MSSLSQVIPIPIYFYGSIYFFTLFTPLGTMAFKLGGRKNPLKKLSKHLLKYFENFEKKSVERIAHGRIFSYFGTKYYLIFEQENLVV